MSILDEAITEDSIAEKWKEDILLVTQSTNPALSLGFLLGKIINILMIYDLIWISVT